MRSSGMRHSGWPLIAFCASAISAMMPPSPRLSARMMSSTYFRVTTTISAQKMVDRPPRMFSGVSAMPCVGENVSFTAYSGLVPMSPNTTPSAASVSPASEDFRVRLNGSKGRAGAAPEATPAPHKLQPDCRPRAWSFRRAVARLRQALARLGARQMVDEVERGARFLHRRGDVHGVLLQVLRQLADELHALHGQDLAHLVDAELDLAAPDRLDDVAALA